MNRTIAIRLAAIALLFAAAAPVSGARWNQQVGFELLFNQGYYSSNWQGDEQTSGSLTATLGHLASRQLAPAMDFEHELALAFGQQVTATDSGDSEWEVSKSEDKIRLDDVLRFTLGAWVDPLLSVQFKSQFVDARDSTTRYVNPLQFLETAGVGRRFYDDSTRKFASEVGFAARQLLDRAADTSLIADAGVSWTTAFRTIVLTANAGYATRLVVYKPLFALNGGEEIGTWPEVDWEHELSARFNKVLSGKVYVQLLFDEKTHEDPRLKQTLGMGLSLAWPTEG